MKRIAIILSSLALLTFGSCSALDDGQQGAALLCASLPDTAPGTRSTLPVTTEFENTVHEVTFISYDAGSGLLGTTEGLPAAILECDGGVVRYLSYNAAYLRRLEQIGISGVKESESLLNAPRGGHPTGVHAAVEAVRDTDEWVTVAQPSANRGANRGVGYARCVARSSDGTAYSFLYFD